MEESNEEIKNESGHKTKSKNYELIIPHYKITRLLIENKYTKKKNKKASVFFSAVLEYLLAEVLDVSRIESEKRKKSNIHAKDINNAIVNDYELNELKNRLNFDINTINI